ncbi:MAG: oligosaccharide flippase family protein [Planctomycetes bacterium]|nr:oligosaccharide flippase family protein [Planctomycetota bacterium]
MLDAFTPFLRAEGRSPRPRSRGRRARTILARRVRCPLPERPERDRHPDATPAAPANSGLPHARLGERAVSGTLWTVIGYGSGQALRLASNLVLARLLAPEHFGVMLLVNVFIQGLTMFSDIGIGPSIIHSSRGDDRTFLDTAWTLQILRGVALWLVACASAPLLAGYYATPELAVVLPWAAGSAVLAGFNSTKVFTTNRHMRYARRTLVELGAQVFGVVVMLAWAWYERSLWALVAGGLANAAGKAVLSHVVLEGPGNRFALDAGARRELFHFGRWIFVSTLITFFAAQIDRILLGKLVPNDELGVYGTALNLASLAPLVGSMLSGSVVYPLLAARVRADRSSLAHELARVRSWFLPCSEFVLLGMALLAPAFFDVLYDDRYADAGWMTVLLMLPFWFLMLTHASDRALLALGNTKALAVSNAASLAGKVAGCLVGYHIGGVAGFILGMTAGCVAGHVVVQVVLQRSGVSVWKQDWIATLRIAALFSGAALLARWLSSDRSDAASTWIHVAVGAALLVPMGVALARRMRLALSKR